MNELAAGARSRACVGAGVGRCPRVGSGWTGLGWVGLAGKRIRVRVHVRGSAFSPATVSLVYKRKRAPPWERPPTSDLILSCKQEQEQEQEQRSNPRQPKVQGGRELAASTSKLGKAGPVRGATAGAGQGDEIGIDPPPPPAETPEQRNKFLVLRLYEALNARDHAAVQSLLAPDLEWWFHGPPKHQHMMRLLTGRTSSSSSFRFVPRSVDVVVGASTAATTTTVIAEGHEGRCYWVHAWTVGPDGVITQLREYFNTDLTVTAVAASAKCVWQSTRPDSATNSLPGLLLAL